MTRTLPITIAILTAAIALLLANTASATPPTTVQMPGDYSQSFSGPDSPCGFDITSGVGLALEQAFDQS